MRADDIRFDAIETINCSFCEHSRGSIVSFVYIDPDVSNELLTGTQDYVLSSCIFKDNKINSDHYLNYFGVFNGNTTGTVRYENCTFHNTYASVSYGLIVLNEGVKQCQLISCSIACPEEPDVQMQSIMILNGVTAPEDLTFMSCAFTDIHTFKTGLVYSSNANTKVLADSPLCKSMEIRGCTFESCTSESGPFLDVTCERFEITENEYASSGNAQQSPISVSVTAGKSVIRDTLFAVTTSAPSRPLMDLKGVVLPIQFLSNCPQN